MTSDELFFMNILLLSKAEIEKTFQKPTVLTPNLLGMNVQGEKAFKITSESMNEGYEVIFGFFNKARYALFRRVSPKPWEEADMRVGMLQIGRLSNWSITSDFADYTEKEGEKCDSRSDRMAESRSEIFFLLCADTTRRGSDSSQTNRVST